MPTFGEHSLQQRATLHPKLQQILDEAIKIFDFRIEEGYRNKEKQDKAVAEGNSKTPWPTSKHNKIPSLAADCYPYPVDYSDSARNRERFVFMHGIFYKIAQELGIEIRAGIDWNRNEDMRDEPSFRDYPHLELYLP